MTIKHPPSRLRSIIASVLWPVLLAAPVLGTAWGFAAGHPVMAFNICYFSLALTLLLLERVMPHEVEWQAGDGQTFANIAHTLMNKGLVQGLVVFGGTFGLTSLITSVQEPGYGIWPREWPIAVQIILGLVTAEFMLYWKHRLAHEWYPLWRFHAVHHSVTRLWVINTGRFHFVDSITGVISAMVILVLFGAPLEVVTWVSAITAFIGILTHCNVDMRCGVFSYVFNTPSLHRWHHSKDLREGNKNYGENLVLWDQIFGTYFNEESRRPPVDIGIPEAMPASFIQQLVWPFRTFRAPKAGE